MGALTLSGTSGSPVTLDFGNTAASSTLVFSSLAAAAKNTYVTITGWSGDVGFDSGAATNDHFLFQSDPGFTQSDLANFNFAGFGPGATEFVYGNMFKLFPFPSRAHGWPRY